MHWFLMLGDLPRELIELANEHIRRRVQTTEDREPRTEKHPNPKLSARNSAASRGEPVPEKTGVSHVRKEACEARKQARLLEKHRVQADEDWSNYRWGLQSMTVKAYYDLKRQEEARAVRQSLASVSSLSPAHVKDWGRGTWISGG